MACVAITRMKTDLYYDPIRVGYLLLNDVQDVRLNHQDEKRPAQASLSTDIKAPMAKLTNNSEKARSCSISTGQPCDCQYGSIVLRRRMLSRMQGGPPKVFSDAPIYIHII